MKGAAIVRCGSRRTTLLYWKSASADLSRRQATTTATGAASSPHLIEPDTHGVVIDLAKEVARDARCGEMTRTMRCGTCSST